MAELSLHHIDKIYDNNVQAVYDFNIDIKDGELIVLVGPSGCGKPGHHPRARQGQGHGHGLPELRPVRPHDHL